MLFHTSSTADAHQAVEKALATARQPLTIDALAQKTRLSPSEVVETLRTLGALGEVLVTPAPEALNAKTKAGMQAIVNDWRTSDASEEPYADLEYYANPTQEAPANQRRGWLNTLLR